MKICFLDTETTGLKVEDGHRIIEITLIQYDLATRKQLRVVDYQINPNRSIDAKAQAVHGISIEDLQKKPTFDLLASDINSVLKDSDVLIAHNMDFDAPFIGGELEKAGLKDPLTADVYCTMANGRWACFDGKYPRLEELCFALGVDYDQALAHSALYDTERLAECFFNGLDRGFFKL